MSAYMPPEWAPHAATWMGFPRGAYPGVAVSDDEVRAAWADVANTIAQFEPVQMLCHGHDLAYAGKLLSSRIEKHLLDIDDAWLRDSGPTFVTDNAQLTAVDWVFNGWGQNTAFDWQQDALVGRAISELSGSLYHRSELVNEGGGIHVNEHGDLLLTQTVQLDPDRNPGWQRDQVESELHRQLGTKRSVWLPRGLYRDYLDHGTRGHVDMVACFAPGNRVLLHQQRDPDHPDQQLFAPLCTLLEQQGFDVLPLVAPLTVRDNTDWVDYSYVNHYVLNDAVVYPTFADRNDDQAREVLAHCYPEREVIGVDGRVLFVMGGGVHCITQQQPALTVSE